SAVTKYGAIGRSISRIYPVSPNGNCEEVTRKEVPTVTGEDRHCRRFLDRGWSPLCNRWPGGPARRVRRGVGICDGAEMGHLMRRHRLKRRLRLMAEEVAYSQIRSSIGRLGFLAGRKIAEGKIRRDEESEADKLGLFL